MKKLVLLLLLAVLVSDVLTAQQWWEKKLYTEWTRREATRLLDDSPWGKIFRIAAFGAQQSPDMVLTPFPVLFHVRFLSSMPVRMAIARIQAISNQERAQSGLEEFVAQSDINAICIALTVSGPSDSQESVRGYWTSLSNLTTPEVTSTTSLCTRSGKRVYAIRYDRPGDDLGAKYYFPRRMPDGSPAVSLEDREVQFETTLTLSSWSSRSGYGNRSQQILIVFDLRKMVFRGKLEI